MSKLRKNKPAFVVEENQKRISAFFQRSAKVPTPSKESSQVCREIRNSQSDAVAHPSGQNGHGIASKLINGESNANLEPPQSSGSVLLVENDYLRECDRSRDNEKRKSSSRDIPNQQDTSVIDISDSEIIPDTPEAALHARNSIKRYPRSFLSNSVVSSGGNLKETSKIIDVKKKAIVARKTHSLQSRLKSSANTVNSNPSAVLDASIDLTVVSVPEVTCRGSLVQDSVANGIEDKRSRRCSGDLCPVPKRHNDRPTPEKIDRVNVRPDLNPLPKRLSFDEIKMDDATAAEIVSCDSLRRGKQKSRFDLDCRGAGGLSKKRTDLLQVGDFCANLDSDETLSEILQELKSNIPSSSGSNGFRMRRCSRNLNSSDFSETDSHSKGAKDDELKFLGTVAMETDGTKSSTPEQRTSIDFDQSMDLNPDELNCTIVYEDSQQQVPARCTDTQYTIEQYSQDEGSSLIDGSELLPNNKMVCGEVTSSAGDKDSQGSVASSGSLCREFEKLSPFKKCESDTTLNSERLTVIQSPPYHQYNRHKVLNVEKSRDEVAVDVESVFSGRRQRVILHGFWVDTEIHSSDIVNVIGDFDDSGLCHVTDSQNFVIVNPDRLISGTAIVSSLHCMRKSVLNEKFKVSGKTNPVLLYGSIIHAIFQKVLTERLFSREAIENAADSILQQTSFVHEMFAQGIKEQTVRAEIDKYLPQIETFVGKYFEPDNDQERRQDDMVVTDVKDIEENFWCPQFGIKGKVDLTVNVKIHDRNTKRVEQKVLPLELKTGKTSFSSEHQGQVTLYTMMFGSRRKDPDAGLLLYLKDLSMKLIPSSYANKRGLVQLRNEMAYVLNQSFRKFDLVENCRNADSVAWTIGSLPHPLNDERCCSNCEQLLSCSLYQKSIECRPLNLTMANLVPATLRHLSEAHLRFFSLWCKLIHLEVSTEMNRSEGNAVLWLHTGSERESRGECLSGMVLSCKDCQALGSDSFIQVFERSTDHISSVPLCDVGILINDSLVISSEDGSLIAVATGIVTHIDNRKVILVTNRDLRKYDCSSEFLFRLDKCDAYSSATKNLSNLSRLMDSSSSSAKLRELIIDKRRPEFNLTLSKSVIDKIRHIMKELNKPQQTAILKMLMCKDYILVKGYPGTGKTSTIVAMIRILVVCGLSVLLTSYTHSAVDNILLKLIPHKVDFLRFGRLDRIHPLVHPYAAEKLTDGFKTVAALSDFYLSKSVVATTCLGTNHPIFSQRVFDVCIVDEASQVLLPSCLGLLFSASRFVLVGDPKQLPPVVQSKEARDLGLGKSLFAVLDEVGTGAYELHLQYRMNGEIMRLSNSLIYDNALQCGNAAVAQARLNTPNPFAKGELLDWQEKCLSTEEGLAVVWLNTDRVLDEASPEDGDHSGVKNSFEATVILSLVQLFVKVSTVRQMLRRSELSLTEVNTVDQYQGRDKCVVIISFVKTSSPSSKTSEILKDARRLNVAMTRARHKIVFIGSISSLVVYEPLKRLVCEILRPEQIHDMTYKFMSVK